MTTEPWRGQLVTIDTGRHRGKAGIFLGFELVQSQYYSRVALSGTQREVRVRTVTPAVRHAQPVQKPEETP